MFDIPRDRYELAHYCLSEAARWCDVMENMLRSIGGKALGLDTMVDPEHLYFHAEFISERWRSLSLIVRNATHEGEAHAIVSEFAAHSEDELVQMSADYVAERMRGGGGVRGTKGFMGLTRGRESMEPSERDALIAKLTENTHKIDCSGGRSVVPGAIKEFHFSIHEPVLLHRLAFGNECKERLAIHDIRLGCMNLLVGDKVSASAYGDPGALIPERPDHKNIIYPGLPMVVRVENTSLEPVHVDMWIGVKPIDLTPCVHLPPMYSR